jgi:hypothetical protein
MKKTLLFVLCLILLVLYYTNPDDNSFLVFLGGRKFSDADKKANYYVCSVYQVDGTEYLAVLGKFYRLNK